MQVINRQAESMEELAGYNMGGGGGGLELYELVVHYNVLMFSI